MLEYLRLASNVSKTFDKLLIDPLWPYMPTEKSGELTEFIHLLHYYNSNLWNEEDLARRVTAPDKEIVENKRSIDRFNQWRNDQIEKIDSLILSRALHHTPSPHDCHRNSETAGSLFDRISIVSLKIFHMGKQVHRTDVSMEHRTNAGAKVALLSEQRMDLNESLVWLLKNLSEGKAYFKIYRQFKMYNDPNLNPALVAERTKS